MQPKVVCFGETLWDIFPDKKIIGGAPLNVALRLNSLGDEVQIISCIGNDPDGDDLLAHLKKEQLSTDTIQRHSDLPTGNVEVHLDSTHTASYTISEPVAWDHISFNKDDIEFIKGADAFIFGSLCCRNNISKNTLITYLSHASFKVFDANLRTPFYTLPNIIELMNMADMIKLNDEELDEISRHLNISTETIENQIKHLSQKTKTKHLCVTLGANGAIFFTNGHFFKNTGYHVTVKDSVGAGDSFLATLVHQVLKGSQPQISINFACAMGAIVASSHGANPPVSKRELLKIINA